jgi:hypothetical protein
MVSRLGALGDSRGSITAAKPSTVEGEQVQPEPAKLAGLGAGTAATRDRSLRLIYKGI